MRYKLLFTIALLAILAYVPILNFPFISDNYTEIPVSRALGSWQAIPTLIHNPVWHFRWSFVFLNSWIVQAFGFRPAPFYIISILLHIACVCAVFAIGAWKRIGWQSTAWGAAFFAVYEGHQEAVMWLAGWTEMFIVFFGCLCFVSWVQWLQTRNHWYYAATGCALIGALLSKESGYIVAALLLLPVILERRWWKSGGLALIPFLLGALCYVAFLASGLQHNPRAGDGSFSLSAPLLLNLAGSLWHLLFVWGILAAAFLGFQRARDRTLVIAVAFAWMILGLLPYSFLTYMHRVPSRQTYLASVGLALLVGTAFTVIQERYSTRLVAAAAAIVILVNIGILWTRKRSQFLERAAPTEALVTAARSANGPIRLSCFPYPFAIAQAAAQYAGGQVIPESTPAALNRPHCLSFSFKDAQGTLHTVTTRPAI